MSLCGLGISCEPPFCDHGKQLQAERCYLCELQRQITALTEMYKELSIRVVAQHDFKIRQIDENRKLSRRVDEIENGLIKRIGILGEALSYLSEENHKLKKIPHKCPVCHGYGMYESMVPKSAQHLDFTCKTCEGKGILWG